MAASAANARFVAMAAIPAFVPLMVPVADESSLSARAARAMRAERSVSSPNPAGRLRRYRSRPSRVVNRSYSAVPIGPIICDTLL